MVAHFFVVRCESPSFAAGRGEGSFAVADGLVVALVALMTWNYVGGRHCRKRFAAHAHTGYDKPPK